MAQLGAKAEDALHALLAQKISNCGLQADADHLAGLLIDKQAVMNEQEVEDLGSYTLDDFVSFGLVAARARKLYNSLHPPGILHIQPRPHSFDLRPLVLIYAVLIP
jgi:hypothetical protein